MLNEKDSNIADRIMVLNAKFSENFARNHLLFGIDEGIKRYMEKIEHDIEWKKALDDYNKVKQTKDSIYFFHAYNYADIPIGKKFEAVGLWNKDVCCDSINYCEIEILAFFNKHTLVPIINGPHCHNGICLAHFPEGIPDIVSQVHEIRDRSTMTMPFRKDDVDLFVCSRETLAYRNAIKQGGAPGE